MKRSTLLATAGVGLLAAGVGACALLPERYAFNAPVLHTIFGRGAAAPLPDELAARIQVAEGFSIGLYAENLSGVRFLAALPDGALLASRPRDGSVWRVAPDRDGDGRADGAAPLLEGLNRPHGLAVWGDWLYVGEGDAVGRVRIDPTSGDLAGSYEQVVTGLPEGGNHWTRSVGIGPDDRLYVSVGSSCNVCFESDERRAAMLRFRPDGSEGEIYATGLRNSVGFDWHPGSGALYATDNGRDLLGDEFPPCELNRIERGGFYGWPIANGNRVLDPDLGAGHEARARASLPPEHGFAAHNAPLGMTFLRHGDQPAEYRGAALVALHGSWNRTRKDGYKVVSLHWRGPDVVEERDFVIGFERDEDVIGRPVDVAEGAAGEIYISDDYAGVIYRVQRGVAAAAGGGSRPATAGTALSNSTPAAAPGDAARGAALWTQHACVRCHDPARAEAGVVAVPLDGLAQRRSEAELAAFLAAPTPPMPLYPLDSAQRAALAAHLRQRFP